MYTRDTWLDLLMHGAVYCVVVLMPFSVLYALWEPLGPGRVELYVTPGLELVDIPAGILLFLAGLDRWLMWRRGVTPPRRTLVFARLVLLLGMLSIASIVGAEAPGLAAYTALRWLLAAALLWAIVQARVAPQRLAYVLAISLCVHAAVALLQVWFTGPLGLPGELTLGPDERSAAVVHLGDKLWLRGYGLTFHPNVLGGYFAVGLALLLPLLSSRLARLAFYLLVLGLIATLSRSAGLGLLLIAPPLAWWLWRMHPGERPGLRRTAAVFGCVVLVSLVIFWRPVSVRLDPLLVQLGLVNGAPVRAEQRSLLGRHEMNALAVEVMWRHPFLGIGAGNFPLAMQSAGTILAPQFVHNVPLLLGAEVGVGGLLLWLALVGWAGVLLLRRAPDTWMAAAVAAWWVLAVISLFDCYPWSLNAGRLLVVTVLALIESSAAAAVVRRSNASSIRTSTNGFASGPFVPPTRASTAIVSPTACRRQTRGCGQDDRMC